MTTYSLIRAQDLVMPMSTLYFLIFLWQLKIPMKDIESDEPPQINNKPNFDTEAILICLQVLTVTTFVSPFTIRSTVLEVVWKL